MMSHSFKETLVNIMKTLWILSFHRFWYYGRKAKDLSEFGDYPSLTKKLSKLGQGHR